MKAIILVFLLLASESQALCLPDSLILNEKSAFDIRSSEDVIESFDQVMKPELPANHELVIRVDSLNPRINADINKIGNEIVIQIMGGMLRHPEMKPDVLQLLLCHELGHLLGGPPLKSRNGWSSTEGQADYYTGLACARLLGFDELTFSDAALKLTSIYAQVVREPTPQLNRCDDRIADRINYGYPSVQCRLDTLIAGWNQQERPRCWYVAP